MRKLVLIAMFTVTILLIGQTVEAYVVDGLVDDWGIDLSLATYQGYLDTNTPSGVYVVTEDNTDVATSWAYVGPGWSDQNYFDVEAFYFTNDADYAYLALIQGMPIGGHKAGSSPHFYPGDIGFDIGQNGVYEFAIDSDSYASSTQTADFYAVSSWYDVYYSQHAAANPWAINTVSSAATSVDFVYSAEQNSHYVLEARVPLSLLGVGAGDSLTLHWAQQCGNDYLNLNADVVPEPTSFFLLLSGLLGFGFSGIKIFRRS